jgi:hypothetical protein
MNPHVTIAQLLLTNYPKKCGHYLSNSYTTFSRALLSETALLFHQFYYLRKLEKGTNDEKISECSLTFAKSFQNCLIRQLQGRNFQPFLLNQNPAL